MSRELGPGELRVCRTVLTLLGLLVVAFAALSAIDLLFDPWPRASNLQSQSHEPSSPLKSHIAEIQKTARQDALADQEYGVGLLRKGMQSQTRGLSLDRTISFNPQILDRRADATRIADADALPKLGPTGTFQTGAQQEIFTASFVSAEPAVAHLSQEPSGDSAVSNKQGQPVEVSPGAASSSREDVPQIQGRLRDLGYLSSATIGIWDLKSRAALRDFKLVNRLADNDTLDFETTKKLNSHTAIRANQSFIGSWSAGPCSSSTTKNLSLTIRSRRVKASTGSICELRNIQPENGGWRVRANCSQGTQHWTANGSFALRGEKLVWASERDVSTYFRCN